MKRILPPPMRSRIEATRDGLLVTIPGPRGWLPRALFTAWPIALLAAAVASRHVIPAVVMLLFFAALCGMAATHVWFGRERIEIREGELRQWWEPIAWSGRRSYDLNHLRRLRPSAALRAASATGEAASGAIAFDYGASTVRIGSGIDEAEARMLIESIAARFPDLDVVTR